MSLFPSGLPRLFTGTFVAAFSAASSMPGQSRLGIWLFQVDPR